MEVTLKNGTKRNSIGAVTKRVLLAIHSTARCGEKMGDGLGGWKGVKNLCGKGCLGMGLAVGLGLDGSEVFS